MVLSRSYLDEEPIVLKEAMPAGCAMVEISGFLPICEVGVISDNGKGVFCSSEVMTPVLESFYYC